VAALSRRLARGIVADLVSGQRRADAEANVIAALRNRAGVVPGGRRPRSPAQQARDRQTTFVAVPMSVDEMASLKARAARAGVSVCGYSRRALGLPVGRGRRS